jgi:hypothetical protein
MNEGINGRLLAISKNATLNITLYQRWQGFYRVRFASAEFGEREVVIDASNMMVMLYQTSSKTLFSPQMTNSTIITNPIAVALTSNMEKIFRLNAGTLLLQWIGKSNDDDIILLEILGRTQVKSQWQQPVFQYFTMRAVFWPDANFIKIVSATALSLFSS